MHYLKLAFVLLLFTAIPLSAQKTLTDGIKDLATQISASATKEQKKRIAVLPFQELDGQSTVLGTYLAEELLSHLVNSGLKIVERGLLDKLLAEQKLQNTGAIDPATAKKVGQVAGVDAIVTGSVTDLQSNVGVNCRIIDTTTGEIFAAAQVKITKDDDVKKILTVVLSRREGQPPSTKRPTGPPSNQLLSWQDGAIQFSIDGLHDGGSTLTTTITVENAGGEGHTPYVGEYMLIDENGDRWRGRLPDGSSYVHVSIPPGTRRRFQYSFVPEAAATGTTFTLTNHDNSRSLLRNLVRQP